MIQTNLKHFWSEFGTAKKMVLSTSQKDHVTSRMVSIIQYEGLLYFQTDCTFRKYEQLIENHHIALCIDNIQIEGICKEIGHPLDLTIFSDLYQKHFPNSFKRYTALKNERLFQVIQLISNAGFMKKGFHLKKFMI